MQDLAEQVDCAPMVLENDAHIVRWRVVTFIRQHPAGPLRNAAETAGRRQSEIRQVFIHHLQLGAHPIDAVQMVNGADIDACIADIQIPEGAEPRVICLGDCREVYEIDRPTARRGVGVQQ